MIELETVVNNFQNVIYNISIIGVGLLVCVFILFLFFLEDLRLGKILTKVCIWHTMNIFLLPLVIELFNAFTYVDIIRKEEMIIYLLALLFVYSFVLKVCIIFINSIKSLYLISKEARRW
jgi:hypothetical protein